MKFDIVSLIRGRTPRRASEIARACAGALICVAATGLAARAMVGGGPSASPLLVAPIGASAVLVFAVPASPLAQPRAVVGGNVVSVLAGLACALLIPQPALAAGAAVALAILAMSLLGCLHPPGGAIALGVALAGAPASALAAGQALTPVVACSLLLVAAAAIYLNLTGRSYPHRVAAPVNAHATSDTPPPERVGFTPADLDAALAQYGELLDVSREDLDLLFRQVELQAHRRIHSQILCSEIMSRDVISVDAHQTAESALEFLQQHDLRTAPVLDARGRVVGMARRAELLAGRSHPVGAVLDRFVHKVHPSAAIETLLPLLSSGAAHEVMVVDKDRMLLGVITQTDLLAVLYRAHIVEAVSVRRAA
jgi:CBS domain-containing membrane protein